MGIIERSVGMPIKKRPTCIIFRAPILSVVLLACSHGSEPEQVLTKIDTLASGVIHVANSSTPMWHERERWRLEEEYRLGSVDEDGPELFTRIRGLEVDVLGRTWIFEDQAQEFRVFDAEGNFVRAVGREGEGPGEFLEVSGLGWAPDATLWVLDPGNIRISVFDTVGALVATHSFDLSNRVFPWAGTIDGDGFFYKLQRTGPRPSGGSVLVRYDTDLAPTDTLPLPVHPRGPQEWTHSEGAAFTTLRIPFAGNAIWRLTRDGGMWIAITDEYRLIRLGPDGDTLRTVTKPFDPVPVTGHEVDSILSRMSRYRGSIDRSQVPSFKPPIQHLLLDDEDNVWVFLLSEEEEDGRKADIFDSEGLFLGTVVLPFPPRWWPRPVIRRNLLVGITLDSLGVPYVVRASIGKANGREAGLPGGIQS